MADFKSFLNEIVPYAKKSRTPIIGLFELTGRCNFKCVMCYVREIASSKVLSEEFSTKEWISIFDTMISKGMIYAVLTGGECMLRTDFKDLYLYLFQHGVKVSINSNGSLISSDYISFFKKYPPVNIQISLYGSCDNAYENVTCRKSFSAVSNTLRLLKEAGINFSVQVTPSKAMLPDFENTIKFLIDQSYPYKIGDFLIENKNGDKLDSDVSLSPNDYVSLMMKNASLRGKTLETIDSVPKPFGDCTSCDDGILCSAGTCRACIDWHGDLYSCYALPLPKYNLKQYGFDKAWELLGEDILSVRAPIECKGCAYEKVCIKCPGVRYKDMYSGHCDISCCDYVVSLVKNGVKKLPISK